LNWHAWAIAGLASLGLWALIYFVIT